MMVVNSDEFKRDEIEYAWDFGDGTTEVTPYRFLTHAYADALGRDTEYNHFEVSVTVSRPGFPDAVGSTTVTVWNSYAYQKQRGQLHPPFTLDSTQLLPEGTALAVNNAEDEAIECTNQQVDFLPCDDEAPPQYGSPEPVVFAIPAGGSLTFRSRTLLHPLDADQETFVTDLFVTPLDPGDDFDVPAPCANDDVRVETTLEVQHAGQGAIAFTARIEVFDEDFCLPGFCDGCGNDDRALTARLGPLLVCDEGTSAAACAALAQTLGITVENAVEGGTSPFLDFEQRPWFVGSFLGGLLDGTGYLFFANVANNRQL